MSRDRELLEKLYGFMIGKNFISCPDKRVIRDMVTRYKQPPLTMHYQVAMQMTVNDYDTIYAILTEIQEYLTPRQLAEEKAAKETIDDTAGNAADWPASQLPSDVLAPRGSGTG